MAAPIIAAIARGLATAGRAIAAGGGRAAAGAGRAAGSAGRGAAKAPKGSGSRWRDMAGRALEGYEASRTVRDLFGGQKQQPAQQEKPRVEGPRLSPSELMSMMGKGRDEIDQAQDDRRQQYEEQQVHDELIRRQEEQAQVFQTTAEIAGRWGAKLAAVTTVGLAGFNMALDRITRAFAETRRELSINAAIGSQFAQLDIARFQNTMRVASGTQGSTSALIRAQREYERNRVDNRQDYTRIGNAIGIVTVKIAGLLDKAEDAVMELTGIRGWLAAWEAKQGDGDDYFTNVDAIRKRFGQENWKNHGPQHRPPLPPLGGD